jgi:NhaP-type Na+/H+ or K+/H+ antiporter
MESEAIVQSIETSNTGLAIAIIGLLIFAAHLFTEIFSRKRIPDVLLLMIIGLVIGPIFGWVRPEDLSSVASVFTAITLIIILFTSGTELNFNTLLNSIKGTMKLTNINFFITTIVVGALAIWIEKFNILTGLMLGAILGGTSSAVVIPMVAQLKMSQKGGIILILESAFSDVLCIVFSWAFMEALQKGALNVGQVLGSIISSFILSSIIGLIAAIFWSYILDKVRHVKNSILTTPAFVFIVYGINEWLGFSGAIAALAFGIGMANMDYFYSSGLFVKKIFKSQPAQLNDTEKQLFSEVVFLLKTFFFIYIGISIRLDEFWPILIGFIITLVLFILRVFIVKISFHGKNEELPVEDKVFMSGIVPKGLAAAVLATIPIQQGIEGGEIIQNIVFAVILFSITFTSVLVPVLEKENAFKRFYQRCFQPKKEQTIEELIDNNQ